MDEDEAYQKAIEADLENLNSATDHLIDMVTRIKSIKSTEELKDHEFLGFLQDLDFARFVVSGIMYLHNKPLCVHEEEDED